MRGAVSFVGAGPGAADLVTLRGASRIADADLVLYTPSVVDVAWLREHTRADADLVDLDRLAADDLAELYRRLASRRHRAVRLVAGDPALTPELREQRELCAKLGLDVEVVPGVSPVSAAAAATGNAVIELGGADTFVLTESDFDRVRDLAADGRTIAVQAPAARAAELVESLTAAGLDGEVPVVVAYKVSRPDETLLRTTVGELVSEVKRANLWQHTLFLIGDALREAKPRAGYVARDSERRWTSRSWRSSRTEGSWRANGSTVATAEPAVDEEEPPTPAPAAEPKPPAKRATTAKKQQARTTRATPRRTTKKP
ncbi:cobalt-precorrin-4/precorrin-4 C(11)-methyltransferase [Actinokineospora enzanensis]|uniref:cobalt-precorrin-4/precorrin-4 C(11)-methyltransferase n=1 Tax=Actinokineospora enzanensis TaxID=155975 RepID=UPI0009FF6792|nr:cobalt-precorrin-4/precorrin-4 C(11)-methyltransferase [Actinokineospora enzanensis]